MEIPTSLDVQLNTQQADCIKTINHITSVDYHNLCTNEIYTAPLGALDISVNLMAIAFIGIFILTITGAGIAATIGSIISIYKHFKRKFERKNR